MRKILLAVPTSCFVESETVKSIYKLKIPEGYTADLEIIKGYAVHQARNIIVDIALKDNYDYVFWIDADIILPEDILSILLGTGKDLISGYYLKKIEDKEIVEIFGECPELNGQLTNILLKDMPKQAGVYKIGACGFGCTLTSTKIFKTMLDTSEDLCFDYVYKKNEMCSEDILFCKKAANLGFDTFVYNGLRCGHIGQKIY